jgi:hypothetical protein
MFRAFHGISTVECLNIGHGNHVSNPTKSLKSGISLISLIFGCIYSSGFSGSWILQAKFQDGMLVIRLKTHLSTCEGVHNDDSDIVTSH